MVTFVFHDEDTDEDDEEYLDLSSIVSETQNLRSNRTERDSEDEDDDPSDKKEVPGIAFEDGIPDSKTLADPGVKEKAKRARKKSPAKMDYAGKRALGWSLFCAHMKHLPTLCEREQNDGRVSCTCECHEARGFKPVPVSGGDEEEAVLYID